MVIELVDAVVADGTVGAPRSAEDVADPAVLLLPLDAVDDDAPVPGSSDGARTSLLRR
jgi:hypothetical protein